MLRWRRFHFSSKSGPSGHALFHWWCDYLLLPSKLRDSIINVGGLKLGLVLSAAERFADVISSFFPSKGKDRYRSISYFADKEGKTRVIAIGDYLSQTVLKGLHEYLYRVLRKIPQDCTFDQGTFVGKTDHWEIYYSVDLSSATDRFPIQVIKSLLEGHLPKVYCDAWEDIMVGYPFDYDGQSIRYSVGNPMGFYSSWASFAVTHHYILYYLCRELGID